MADYWDMAIGIYNHPDFWKFVAIPFIAAVVGWWTNWLALKLTFHPVEPIGWPPFFGWQGVIPSKAEKMSGIFVDSSLAKLGSTQEIFEALEADKLKDHMVQSILPRTEEFIDDIMRESNAVLWENLPRLSRELIYARARWQLPRIADKMMKEITDRADELVDLKDMSSTALARDKHLLNRMFLECGKAEFDFVIKAGLWLGLVFGVVQMIVWLVAPAAWVLPVFGFLVGAATNWIALNAIFRPLYPKKVGPFTFLGLFIKRQRQVSAVFARLSTRELLTVSQFIEAMMTGPNEDRTRSIIRRHLRPAIDEGVTKFMTQIAVGPKGYVELKTKMEDAVLDLSTEVFDDKSFNEERAAHVEKLLYERMVDLTPEEYQELIRPAFEEDEWILIAIGGALGFLAGLGQFVFLFGQSLMGG